MNGPQMNVEWRVVLLVALLPVALVSLCASPAGADDGCDCNSGQAAGSGDEKPNILLFLLDDVGADRFSFYGSDIDMSPNINEVAEKATVFDAFFAQPICGPSRACLLSGRYTSNSQVYGNGHRLNDAFDESECTLGSTFQNAGYNTGLLGKLHAAHPFVNTLNTSCGFDRWAVWGRMGPRYRNSTIVTNIGDGNLSYDGFVNATLDPNGSGPARTVAVEDTYHPHLNRELAKAFISSSKEEGKPFFLDMSMILTHGPYEDKPHDPSLPPGMAAGENGDDLFNQRLMVADAVVGDVLRHLEVEGLDNNTIVVITSDNGTPRKYPSIVDGVKTKSGKRHAEKTKGTRVPLVIYDPRIPDPVKTVRPSTNIYDMLPSLMEAAGITELPAGKDPLDGSSFWQFVTGKSTRWAQWAFLFSKTRKPHAVIRNRKIIITSDGEVYEEKQWYKPRRVDPEVICRRRKFFRRLKRLVDEAWKLDIDFTLPGSSTALSPNSCSKIVCNDTTGLPDCVPASN